MGLLNLDISSVPAEHVDYVWSAVEPMIERGMSRGEGDSMTVKQLKSAIESGEMILWVAHDGPEVVAAIVLNVVSHPAKVTLFVVLIAGRDFSAWAPRVQELLCEYAALIGADTIEASVRDGLTKWLAPMGWKRKATIMELKR